MNQNKHMTKYNKLIFCFTGEPRSFMQGLKNRKKFYPQLSLSFCEIETRYLICYFGKRKSNNKIKILDKIKYFKNDKFLRSLRIENRDETNIFSYILQTRIDILSQIKLENINLDKTLIVLTRTDWLFTKQTIELINISVSENKVVTPSFESKESYYMDITYHPITDYIFVIPGTLINKFLETLSVAINIINTTKRNDITKNNKELLAKGIGFHKKHNYGIGMGVEDSLGAAFSLTNLNNEHKSIPFEYYYEPDMYGLMKHNIIRKDAHLWMNYTIKKLLTLYVNSLKSKIYRLLRKK